MKLLEQRLDNMVIGGLKLHANLPRHTREMKTEKLQARELEFEEEGEEGGIHSVTS